MDKKMRAFFCDQSRENVVTKNGVSPFAYNIFRLFNEGREMKTK